MKNCEIYPQLNILESCIGCYDIIGIATLNLAFLPDEHEVNDNLLDVILEKCMKNFSFSYNADGDFTVYRDGKQFSWISRDMATGNQFEDWKEVCRILCLVESMVI
jgi:hypothetical protein